MCALSLVKQLSPTAGTQKFSEECARTYESLCVYQFGGGYLAIAKLWTRCIRASVCMAVYVFVCVQFYVVAFISTCVCVLVLAPPPPESLAMISIWIHHTLNSIQSNGNKHTGLVESVFFSYHSTRVGIAERTLTHYK